MNPFDYSKAAATFWAAQGQALLKAQEQAGMALVEGMKAVTSGKLPMMPEMPTDLSADAAELTQASKSVMDLWSAAAKVCGTLATNIASTAGGDGIVDATFRKIVDPRSWLGGTGELDDVLGRMAEGPRFADLWEAERRYAGVLQAWMNVRRRGLEHNAVVLQAWLQAGRRFSEQLASQTGAGTRNLDAKAALALWTETANQQLLETQRSEPFLQSQAAMVRATTALRMAQQELVEDLGKQFGFPTRTELDDVHRSVTELRRELRAMRREQRTPPLAEAPKRPDVVEVQAITKCTSRAPALGQAKRSAEVTQTRVNPSTAVSEAARLGTKMLTGGKLLHDLRDADVQIATSPKDLVWSQDKVRLFHFRPLVEKRVAIPMLICYGLIGRWTMTDLQEDRSLVRNLLNLGLDLYVVDWGNPSRADRYLTLDDYILGYLGDCVSEIAKRAGVPKINLLGVCEGGVFATAYAALEPERINTLTLTITPIDFHADTVDNRLGHGFINIWTRSLSPEDVDRLIDANGNLPGEFMGAVFNQMSPMRSLLKYNLDLLEIVDDEQRLMNWLRMEKWIADRPDHPGEAAKQWMKDLYQQNKLIRNEWELDGRQVDLGQIRMPVLNVYAKDDHIIPPATSRALGPKLGRSNYTELALPGGHIGVFVGGRSQALFAPAVHAFVEEHDWNAE